MLQNRIDPWGRLCADQAHGTLMGNRGILHNEQREVVRPWAHQAWVTCQLEFGTLKRPTPLWSSTKNYSELFFLDEATAFSAGHRPCNFCQRVRSQKFKTAWIAANAAGTGFVSMTTLDKVLHNERVQQDKSKLTFESPVGHLPVGTMFADGDHSFLTSNRGFLPWSFDGYGKPVNIDAGKAVRVLTPSSVVKAFAQGFTPNVHPSGM